MKMLLEFLARGLLAGSLVFAALALAAASPRVSADVPVDPSACDCEHVSTSGTPCDETQEPPPPPPPGHPPINPPVDPCFLQNTYCSLTEGSGDVLHCFQRQIPIEP